MPALEDLGAEVNWPAFWVGVGLLGVGLTLWTLFTIAWAATRGTRDGEDTSWGFDGDGP